MWDYLIIDCCIIAFVVLAVIFVGNLIYIKCKRKTNLKNISKIEYFNILCRATFMAYLAAVIYITLIRSDKTPFHINMLPFKSAETLIDNFIYAPSLGIELDFVIGNILMFVPFGFLLPLVNKKCNKYYKVFLASIIAVLSIESAQLVFSKGVFDIDDFIYNVTGSILGYGIYKIIIGIFYMKEKKIKTIIQGCIPFLIIGLFVLIAKILYIMSPYGFMPGFHIYDAKPYNIPISAKIDDDTSEDYVCKKATLDFNQQTCDKMVKGIFNFLGVDYKQIENDENTNSKCLYVSLDNEYKLEVFNNYTFDLYFVKNYDEYEREKQEELEENVLAEEIMVTNDEYINNTINYFNKLLDNAEYDTSDKGYLCLSDIYPSFSYNYKGNDYGKYKICKEVNVEVTKNEKIAKISLCNNVFMKTKDKYRIISTKEAYEKLKRGEFGQINTRKNEIISIQLLWWQSTTKGYYLPQYVITSMPTEKTKESLNYDYVPAWEFE